MHAPDTQVMLKLLAPFSTQKHEADLMGHYTLFWDG
jgi:hypothetical protein